MMEDYSIKQEDEAYDKVKYKKEILKQENEAFT